MNYKKIYKYTKLKRWVKDHCEDVTYKYTNNEIENYKTPTREEGYADDSSTESDELYATFIQKCIGGVVEMKKRGGADYNWNFLGETKEWEKKAPRRFSSISNRVRDAYKQLSSAKKIGGLFFDLDRLEDCSYKEAIWKTLSELEQKGGVFRGRCFDVIFTANNKVIIAYRIKK